MTIAGKRIRCRACGAERLRAIANFGEQPLAGYYAATAEAALNPKRYPLVLESCPACDLLQITDLPPIEQIFHEDYTYASSQVAPLVKHFSEYADWLTPQLDPAAAILEFGCNDGVLLDQLRSRGFEKIAGVDASPNMVALARARSLDVTQGFFGKAMLGALERDGGYGLITCSNVFAHIDDLADVLAAAWRLLEDGGLICIEVHDAEKLILDGQFETIYHEHLTYFSAATLGHALLRHGFEVQELGHTAMHGGGLRVAARKITRGGRGPSPLIRTDAQMVQIGASLLEKVRDCAREIANLQARYGPLDGYGMAGRSQMFLSMTRTASAFGALYDDAPIRQGRYAVGTSLKIEPFDPANSAETCVILAWNYADAIFRKIKPHYRQVFVMFPSFARLQ